jgi:hypothetical protein
MPPPVPPSVKLGRMTVGSPPSLHRPGLVHAVGDAGARGAQTDLGHGVLELQAVFGLVDGFGLGADQLDLVLVQHAVRHRSSAQFSAVWPPMVGRMASGAPWR